MRSAKKYITPIDMEIIDRAHRSVWTLLNQERRVADYNEARELSDRVTRKLVEVAREGVIDLDRLRERTLAEIASLRAEIALDSPGPHAEKNAAMAHYAIDPKSERLELPGSSLWISRITLLLVLLCFVVALA
jgi:hypothetical protein